MKRRHGPRLDFSPEPVAQHDVIALAQLFHESRHVAEVVAVVRVPHNNEGTSRAGDARSQCCAVPPLLHANHARAMLFRNLNRTVRRPVVRNHHFAA